LSVPEISVDELATARAAGAVVFDVREPDEYAEVRVPGVVHIPMAEVPEQVEAFEGHTPAYVICASGGRSARVVQFLMGQGIDAVNVAGGTHAWVAAGLPTASGPAGADESAAS